MEDMNEKKGSRLLVFQHLLSESSRYCINLFGVRQKVLQTTVAESFGHKDLGFGRANKVHQRMAGTTAGGREE